MTPFLLHKFEDELTAVYPEGLVFNPPHSDERFLSGDPSIHQWRIKKGVDVRVDQNEYRELYPNKRFPYDRMVNQVANIG